MTAITLVCAYTLHTGHRLARADWSPQKNAEVFGKCTNNHGHQYRLEIMLAGNINPESGMLINGFDVDKVVQEKIVLVLDHKFLNDDVAHFRKNLPTAENIAQWCFAELDGAFPAGVKLSRIRLYETPDLYVEYTDSP